jgi:2-dehydropantoate 2-reductase
MKILIYGVGGVGGFLGAHLQKIDLDVSYVARGKRYSFLKSNGLEVKSALGNVKLENINVFKSIPEKINFDIMICTVKLYDFDNFISELKDVGIKKTVLLPFQNGIYSEQKIVEEFGEKKTYGAVAQISSFVNEDQQIIHKGSLASFFVGGMKRKNHKVLENFCNRCESLDINIKLKKNIEEKIWEKFIFLSAYSGITTLTKKTIGQIFESPELKNKFRLAMIETYNLAKNFEVKFNSNPIEYWLEKINKMPYDMTSSMYIDYVKGKKLELKWLSGFIVKHSIKFKINCQTHEEIIEGINLK